MSAALLAGSLASCGNAPVPTNTASQPGAAPTVVVTAGPTAVPTTSPVVETPTAGEQTPGTQTAEQITKYQQLWLAQNIKNYSYRIDRSCMCVEAARGPVVVAVNGDTATVTNAATGETGGEFFTDVDSIDKIFALLLQQQNDGADEIAVTYDEATGVPLTIKIDKSFQIADEELYYTLSDFKTDAAAGGEQTPGVQTAEEIAKHQQQWLAQNIKNYHFTIERSCFCAPGARGPVVVTVDGDTVTITDAATGEPGGEFFADVNSIDKIYAWLVQEQADGADEIVVTYDETTGVPLTIKVDKSFQMADEEMYYTLSNFGTGAAAVVETPTVGDQTAGAPTAEDIAKHQQQWIAQNITHYTYRIERSCKCLDAARGPVVVEVNGDTTTVTDAATGETGNEYFADVASIDKIYTLLQQQQNDGADEIVVTYDEATGVPLTIKIDRDVQMTDEELNYTLSDFAVMQ